jgi:UDP-3-O-[3-hydroxymyristoyl] glucosamine N-acyltransferase
MRLTELPQITHAAIARDGEFATLGLLSDDVDQLLVALYDRRFRPELLANPHVSAVITTRELAAEIAESLGLMVAEDPLAAFFAIHEHLCRNTDFYWSDFESDIAPDARIHPTAVVARRNVRIGSGAVVEPHATVHERSLVGCDVVLRTGCVIGGAGFHPRVVGASLRNVHHAGGVIIDDRVEVQNNTVVVRCTFRGFTRVGAETILSSLVNVAHNVRIGRRCRIGTGARIAGSARIGDDVWIGPNATISNLVRIGDGAAVSLGSVVVRDVAAGQRVTGNFAIDHQAFLRWLRQVSQGRTR